jgi:hypothetical protein
VKSPVTFSATTAPSLTVVRLDAIVAVVPAPVVAVAAAITIVGPDPANAERDAARFALGPERKLRAGALDVCLQVAADRLAGMHLDAVAIVLRDAHGARDVLDDHDERLPCCDRYGFLELACGDDVRSGDSGAAEERSGCGDQGCAWHRGLL